MPAYSPHLPRATRTYSRFRKTCRKKKPTTSKTPKARRRRLPASSTDYNARYGTNHRISEFDLYYQDVQKRIKDQQYPNADLPHAQKIDITIVVDMLLTGFDSKYLNTLYVDKNLKHHGLIQAFRAPTACSTTASPTATYSTSASSRTAWTKPLRFFSGEKVDNPREIWLVEPAAEVLRKYEAAVAGHGGLHGKEEPGLRARGGPQPQGRHGAYRIRQPLQGSAASQDPTRPIHRPRARAEGADGSHPAAGPIAKLQQHLSGHRQAPEGQQASEGEQAPPAVQQLDFEFVLFASSLIDYDYIMGLIARMTAQKPGKTTMSREQLIGLIQADAKFIDEREDIAEYIRSLPLGEALK